MNKMIVLVFTYLLTFNSFALYKADLNSGVPCPISNTDFNALYDRCEIDVDSTMDGNQAAIRNLKKIMTRVNSFSENPIPKERLKKLSIKDLKLRYYRLQSSMRRIKIHRKNLKSMKGIGHVNPALFGTDPDDPYVAITLCDTDNVFSETRLALENIGRDMELTLEAMYEKAVEKYDKPFADTKFLVHISDDIDGNNDHINTIANERKRIKIALDEDLNGIKIIKNAILAKYLENAPGDPINPWKTKVGEKSIPPLELIKLYKKEYAKGSSRAAREIALIYHEGKGVKANLTEAKRWYQKGVKRADHYSQITLSRMTFQDKNSSRVEKENALLTYAYGSMVDPGILQTFVKYEDDLRGFAPDTYALLLDGLGSFLKLKLDAVNSKNN